MPHVEFITYRPTCPPEKRETAKPNNDTDNTTKLEIWNTHMQAATEPVIFADCDMLCVRDASDAFDQIMDIGITYQTAWLTRRVNPPMNGGIVFAMPTPRARYFFRQWTIVNAMMYQDENLHFRYQQNWLGMNQAAYGRLVDEGIESEVDIWKLPTRIWNATDKDWANIDDETRFIHIKSLLRARLLSGAEPCSDMAKAMRLWRAEEAR